MTHPFRLAVLAISAIGLAACALSVPPSTQSESLVEKVRTTVEAFKQRAEPPNDIFRAELRNARGIVVLPGVIKGGLFVGAEVGDGVLFARDDTGAWGYPAFYTLGAGNVGIQIGAEASEVVLVLRSDEAVAAVVNHQGKLGAELEVTGGTVGAGIGAATTANVGADIVAFSKGAGLYGGGVIEGAVLARRKDLNEGYYGAGATPQAIVLERKHTNAHADILRNALAVN